MVYPRLEIARFPATQWPRAPAIDMTEEKLMTRYNFIEKKWLASESHRDLLNNIGSSVDAKHAIKSCVCFGTGTPSGLRQGVAFKEDMEDDIEPDSGHALALYQIAIFKSVADGLARHQGFRPTVFAQEPTYSLFDVGFLAKLGIEAKHHPDGFHMVNKHTLAYMPGAEFRVALEVMKNDPAMFLGMRTPKGMRSRPGMNYKTSGFETDLEYGGVVGSNAATHIEQDFDSGHKWYDIVELDRPEEVASHHQVFEYTSLAVRHEATGDILDS